MVRATVPGSVRTLSQARPGDRVVVNCLLRPLAVPRCLRCALSPDLTVTVRDVGPDGVLVTLPDGTPLLVQAECAAGIQVEPAGPGLSGPPPSVHRRAG